MTTSLRLVFAGTPDFAARHLAALLSAQASETAPSAVNYQLAGVFTQPDRPAGRGKKPGASAVKLLAQQHQLPLFQPASLRTAEGQQMLASLHADVLVVVAYGLILPAPVLAMPRFGCLNVHGSLLPRWRGAAPIQRALQAGDTQTGITIMQMNEGLDCGDMLCHAACPISEQDTSATLYEKLAQLGPPALLATLAQLARGELSPVAQDESLACYAHKLTKEEARLNWTDHALSLSRAVRAFNPWPVSWTQVNGEPLKIWQASLLPATDAQSAPPGTILSADKQGIAVATGQGALNLQILQPAGKKPMPAADLLNARRGWFTPGSRLH